MMKVFSILLLSLLVLGVFEAQACDVALDDQNVCLYGTSVLDGDGEDIDRTRCQTVNNNPFAVVAAAGSGSPSAAQCEAFAREDGSECVSFYASYVCSSVCGLCNKLPCQNFCTNYQSKCPTAAAAFCFKSISCVDGTAGVTCTRWSADSSQIPSPSATTHTTIVTTSHTTTSHSTTTGTGTDTDDFSSGNILSLGVFFILGVFSIYMII